MKRIISFVLCLSMLISMLPINAFAAAVEDTTPVTEVVQETAETAAAEAPVAETTEAAEPSVEETIAAATEAPATTAATEAPEVTTEATEPVQTESGATEPEETVAEETVLTFTWIPDVELPSDEELFAGYAEKVLYGGVSLFGTAAGDQLSGDTRLAYDAYREMILEIAAGQRDSAELTFRGFTGTELPENFSSDLFYALLADLPYELYWFDKTTGVGGTYGSDSSGLYATLCFSVSPHYSATGAEKTYDLDTAKTGAAATAAANAQSIVDEYADASDYEKLIAYRDEIMLLTAYNDSAASSTYDDGYGDPWQLIWVFDGLGSTKVVCEGYAKAYQYLCDLSDFDADITCYSVQGTMDGGGHMWNIVSINGSSYLVDVTNSELGTVGYKDKLTLVGAAANSDGSYTFANTNFAYNAETIALWGSGEDSILTLAESNFDPDSLVSAPEADTTTAMTGEELLAAMEAAEYGYNLRQSVVITEDITLPSGTYLTFGEGSSITVEDGATLTISAYLSFMDAPQITVASGGTLINRTTFNLYYGASFTVEEGGSLTNNSNIYVNEDATMTSAGTLVNNGDISVRDGKLSITGTYEHSFNGVLRLYTYAPDAITGVDTSEIMLDVTVDTEAELIDMLSIIEEYTTTSYIRIDNPDSDGDGIFEPITLTQSATIPANALVQIRQNYNETAELILASGVTLTNNGGISIIEDGTLTVLEGATLINNDRISNYGTLTVNGTFTDNGTYEGNAPAVTMTGAELLAELEACGGYYELSGTVIISEDMTIPEVRVEVEGGTILVKEGVTLTNTGGIVIRDGGAVTVDGTLSNNGWYLDVEDGGSLTIDGTLTGNDMQIYGGSLTANGALDIDQVNVGVLTLDKITLTNVPEEKINYAAVPTTTDELIAALALVEQYNPWIGLNQDLTLTKNVTIPAGANVAFENSTLTVASGVTLTLDGEFTVHPNSHLVVAEGGKLVSNVNLGITNHSSHENGAVVTINGELVSNGQIWITDGGTLNVSGSAVAYDAIHAGFGGNGLMCAVNVSGELTTYGYLNIVEATGELNVNQGGTVTVGGTLCDDQGNPYANGFLQAAGNVNVSGTLNLDGGFTLGCENGTSELNVTATGVVNVPQGNMWCDIVDTGLVSNEGTVNNNGIINDYGTIVNYGTFNNNGQIRLFGNGTYDDYNDAVISGNEPIDGPTAQLQDFLNDLEDGQGADLYNNVTLAEDLTIDLGTDNHLIIWDGAELHVPSGVTLTINSHVAVNDGAIIVEEGGTLIVNTNVDFNAVNAVKGHLIVNGHLTVNDGGTLWINHGAMLEVNGTAEILDDPATTDVGVAIHVGFAGAGTLNVNGTLSTSGYLNVGSTGWLNLSEDGTLNILNDETGCGYLEVWGMAQLRGTVNLDGLMASCNGNENGEYKDATARVEIYGTLNGSDTSAIFVNPNASISVTGTMETAGEVKVENMGTLWVDGDVALNGPVTSYGNIHVNCFTADSGNSAELTIDGEVTNYGYLCVHPEGSVYVNGTLNIAQTVVEDQGYAGYLNSFGYVYINGTVNNYALMDTSSDDGSGFIQINDGGVLNVRDNIVMAVGHKGQLIIDGTLNVFTGAYMEVCSAVSGSGSWINNGIVHFGVYTDEETSEAFAGYSNFSGTYTQNEYDGCLEVELYEGEPIYIDLVDVREQTLVYTGNDITSIRTVLRNQEYTHWVYVTDELTLDDDLVIGLNGNMEILGSLTIPEGVTMTAYGLTKVTGQLNLDGTLKLYHPSSLSIGEGGTATVNGTVFNGTSTWVHGDLVVNGSWEGYPPTAVEGGSITGAGVPTPQDVLNTLLAAAENGGYDAHLTFDVTLTEDTVINGTLIIDEGYTLTVPKGITLYNKGRISIQQGGILALDGKLLGNLPELNHPDAQFIVNGDISYTQNDLEAQLAAGGTVNLSIPLTLTKDLVIPEGATLRITGSGAITVPAGRTLTVGGWIDVDYGAALTAVGGGVVKNNGGISVMNDASVNLTGGVYEHADWAQLRLVYSDEGPGTAVAAELVGVPYKCVTIVVEGWDENHLRSIINLAKELYPIRRLQINITGEMTLTDDLTIPEYASVVIQNVGYGPAVLTVPAGVTLTNNGHIQIGWDGHLIVENRGALTGNQPIVYDMGGEYVNNSFTEANLRTYIDEAALTGGEVFLSTDITLTGDLVIPENVIVVISKGGALRVPAGVTLTVNGTITTQLFTGLFIQGGTVVNNGNIENLHWGVTELTSGEYTGNGRLAEIHISNDPNYRYDPETGTTVGEKDAGSIVDIAPSYRTIVARGCSEYNIHEVLDYAEGITTDGSYPAVEINVYDGELYLTEDLTIPAYASMTVDKNRQFGGTVIVPEDVTLTNNGYIHISDNGWMEVLSGGVLANNGSIDIGWAGTLAIRAGGAITGNHPFCYDTGSTYINENAYGQAYLEALIAEAQANGTNTVTLSVPVTLTSDLVIPKDLFLYITGRDNFITIPEGVTLYNNGHIYCHMFGGILGQGGWLANNGEIWAMNWGAVDMSQSWGNYSSDTGARIHNHHWILTDGAEGRGTVVGFYPSDVIVHTEGDDDRVIHEMVDFIWNVGDSENGVWSALDSTITGDMTLTQDLYWPFFGTMTIPEGVTLTVPAGVTLDITGTVILRGRLVIEEGAVVNTNYPICVEDGEITGGDESVRYYIPGTALEGFTVTTSAEEAAPGQAVSVWADSWTPAHAEVLRYYYEITSDNGYFTLNGEKTFFSDPGQPAAFTGNHGGEVTVTVQAVVGMDEYGNPIFSEQVQTVSVTFSGLMIGVETKDAPDFIENAYSDAPMGGLWAGGKTIIYPTLTDSFTGEALDASAVNISFSEGYEQFAKIVNKSGVLTITALTTLTQRETIDITFTAGGAAPYVLTFVLRPKATAANVLLNGETVTGQTILADLNRGDTGFQLTPSGTPADAVPENGTLYSGAELVTWKSSAPAIATVDETGYVSFTGEKTGKVKITMTANYGAKKTAVVTFNVVALPQEIFSSETNPTVLVGGGSGTYTAIDAEGTVLKSTQVKWYLSDENGAAIDSHPYASIAATGKLTTRAVADETKVYLMAQVIGDEWSATLHEPVCVTMYPAIESVQILDVINDPINGKTLLYDIGIHGMYYQLSWKAAPYVESVQSVSWKSSKPAVADIDENGLITVAGDDVSGAVKFTLTVTALNGKKSTASFTMKFGTFTTALDLAVTMPDGSVTTDLSELIVYGGETLTFTGSCLPENVTTDGIVWSVLDKTYGAISAKGVLKTKAVNNPTVFTLVAESKDGYCAYYIDIILMPKQVSTPNGMMDPLVIANDYGYITKTTQTLRAGDGMWLYANEDVTWKSSNTKVATVDADGVVEALANGTTTITATAADGSKRTAAFTLKVAKLSEYVEITTKKGEPFTVASGKSLDLVGTVTYSDNSTDKKVTWSVDDTSVATISSSGKLAAAKGLTKAATVRVYADAKDGNSWNFVDVRVVPVTTAIEVFGPFGTNGRNTDVSNTTVTWDMLNGKEFTLNAAVYPFDAMQDVTWKSSAPKIATVNEYGNVTCLKSGTATITATAKDGSGKKATFKLTVIKTMEYLELPETAVIGGGKSLTLTKLEGYAIDTLATNQTLNWSMTYPDGTAVPTTVAILTKGVLKTKAVTDPVTLFVRAEATDGSGLAAQCIVTVCPLTTAVSITNAPETLSVGASVGLNAACNPSSAAQEVTWKSSNAAIAAVDENGVVTAKKTGTVTITATAADGSGKKATAKIKVVPAPEPGDYIVTAETLVFSNPSGSGDVLYTLNAGDTVNIIREESCMGVQWAYIGPPTAGWIRTETVQVVQ